MSLEQPPLSEEVFTGMERPPLPPALRQRVLARARASAGRRSWIDRLWESRPLRLAWCASVVLLLGVQWGLGRSMTWSGSATPVVVERPAVEPSFDEALSATEPDLRLLLARHPLQTTRDSERLDTSDAVRRLNEASLL